MPAEIPAIKNDCRDLAFEALKPAYEWVGRQVPRAVTPNQLTMAGLGCAVLASALLVLWPAATACFVAAGLLFLYEGFDALDGIHARNTQQSSAFGAYLDAVIDAAQAAMIFSALIVRYDLYAPFFIFIMGFRMMVACWIHAYTIESRIRINPALGSTVENYMIVGTLLAAGLFPGKISLAAMTNGDSAVLEFLTAQKLADIGVVEGSFVVGLVVLLIVAFGLVREAKRTLTTKV
jgi:phosphatidylglycerophosphate synthase